VRAVNEEAAIEVVTGTEETTAMVHTEGTKAGAPGAAAALMATAVMKAEGVVGAEEAMAVVATVVKNKAMTAEAEMGTADMVMEVVVTAAAVVAMATAVADWVKAVMEEAMAEAVTAEVAAARAMAEDARAASEVVSTVVVMEAAVMAAVMAATTAAMMVAKAVTVAKVEVARTKPSPLQIAGSCPCIRTRMS
jgi:hypothetical protein